MATVAISSIAQPTPEPRAEGTASHFFCTLETTAQPEAIWRVWTDVEKWPTWDTELDSARLHGVFRAGTSGTLKPKSGSMAQFVIEECTEGSHYTFSTALPFGALKIRRTLEYSSATGRTQFTHDVQFTGVSGWFFAWLLGNQYKTALPNVMMKIRALAEQQRK
jgi:hypothetical protein